MSDAFLRACSQPGCPNLVAKGYCQQHQRAKYQQHNKTRDKKSITDYKSERWKQASRLFRKQNPLCCMCTLEGITTLATVTDHKTPVAEGGSFWDHDNWQPLCESHHNQKTRQELNRRR